MWSGWNRSISFGRTSQPQVSVAMAATSCAYNHGAVCRHSPGEAPPL